MEPSPPSSSGRPAPRSSRRGAALPAPSPAPQAPLWIEIASHSDSGCVRENNEDALLAVALRAAEEPPDADAPAFGRVALPVALGVCDGMGGAAAGEIASRAAVRLVGARLARLAADVSVEVLGRSIVEALEQASRAVHAEARANPRWSGMGTTATICGLAGVGRDQAELVIGQVGDSRAYLLRQGDLKQLTRDQTLAQLLIERGQLQPEERDSFPGAHVILQAVGTSDRLEVDLSRVGLEPGDVLLICSDGLPGALDDEVLREELAREGPVGDACARLIELALAAGATDNVTCVVARVGRGAAAPPRGGAPRPRPLVLAPEPLPPPEAQPDAVDEEEVPQALRSPGLLDRLARLFRSGDPKE